ncbi:NADH-quinone oxidoreductase, E subunit [Beutenbergia cavernae DSM 12333]|uniref:NADH-quinone oxidoreductase, E subunit n=1 Tax=Beutenbergia cavernae (strain ATCC BAA-8 / DSM 12333 / CCUG 43141 / JCM 11478 / NBRC 16432 / NCIMB 13614 / HKI 0122) TaxID=471853 RepID=C5C0S3_BEUC1|nr:NADH-quinone oxidoreductase subunit NuoE [Beutenbergia cavernae]ACQ81469.1 NADH-quinone oxidoreductase, E subunit [Beutenbergia cavernae DSM 12333]
MSGHARTYAPDVEERLRADAAVILERYPEQRSALLPLLHLVQAEDSYVSPAGIALCADLLGLTNAEVSAVATFYTQYKRRPNGRYTVGVCTNTLCAVMGGDEIFDRVSERLGVGHDETTQDGAITLERIECNAACDYAPVLMVNWEFFDNQTPTSAVDLVEALAADQPVTPTRGAAQVQDFRATSRVLAGFEDGRADEGPGAGEASLVGLRIAREHGWSAPEYPGAATAEDTGTADVAAAEAAGTAPVGEQQSSTQHTPPTPSEASGERPDDAPAATAEEGDA